VRFELVFAEIGPVLLHHEGADALAPLGIAHADDGDLAHVRMRFERLLDLGGVHVDAARDDHVALPTFEEITAASIFAGEIADREEAGLHRVGRGGLVGVSDSEWGERVRAFVVKKDGTDLGEDELKAHCKARLAGPKVPRDFVFIDALPRNPTGKVLKRELRERTG
jgi:hypothetical protein